MFMHWHNIYTVSLVELQRLLDWNGHLEMHSCIFFVILGLIFLNDIWFISEKKNILSTKCTYIHTYTNKQNVTSPLKNEWEDQMNCQCIDSKIALHLWTCMIFTRNYPHATYNSMLHLGIQHMVWYVSCIYKIVSIIHVDISNKSYWYIICISIDIWHQVLTSLYKYWHERVIW